MISLGPSPEPVGSTRKRGWTDELPANSPVIRVVLQKCAGVVDRRDPPRRVVLATPRPRREESPTGTTNDCEASPAVATYVGMGPTPETAAPSSPLTARHIRVLMASYVAGGQG